MSKREDGQVVEAAGRGAWTYDAQPVGLEPWADRGSLRSGRFLYFKT
jgi:hypothetical protein